MVARRPSGKCTICRHFEHGRIDYLIAGGAAVLAVSKQFKLPYYRLYRHSKRHISDEYRKAVLIGPLKDEETLRKLAAQTGVSVLENLQAIHAGLVSRWLANLEAGADAALVPLTAQLLSCIDKQGRISGELMPNPQSITNNFYLSAQWAQVQGVLIRALMPFPEARARVISELRALEAPAPTIEHQHATLAAP